ncbi:MAG TPA: ArsA-related P-loop ATPase, partial [Solirubrobacteraceae bacterium]|nr:ArsA-related P-loop ATPase [Solirubrobacteraceae bacterium]
QLGKRTIVADLHTGGDASENEFASGLFRTSIDPQLAMEEYLTVKVGGAAGQLLSQSRLFAALAMATPGMRELLSLGKVWELAQTNRRTPGAEPYDLTIVDAPASGHGLALLRTPRTFAEIARVGPIANQADTIARTLADRAFTAYVAVAIPEELAVTETLELDEALQRERLNLDLVVLNQCHPDRFDEGDRAVFGPLAEIPHVALALAADARAQAERAQAARLRERFAERLLELPFLFDAAIERPQLEQLGQELAP